MKTIATLAIAILVCAWADAQQAAAPLTAAERRAQLQANRKLIEKLVSQGIVLANANEPLKRADACRHVMNELSSALDSAITAQDPNRVAELGDHLTAIVDGGLIPNLKEALPNAAPGSPAFEQFQALSQGSATEMQRLEQSVPRIDAFGRSAQVKAMLAAWGKSREQLAAIR